MSSAQNNERDGAYRDRVRARVHGDRLWSLGTPGEQLEIELGHPQHISSVRRFVTQLGGTVSA